MLTDNKHCFREEITKLTKILIQKQMLIIYRLIFRVELCQIEREKVTEGKRRQNVDSSSNNLFWHYEKMGQNKNHLIS